MARGNDTGDHPNRQVGRERWSQTVTLEEYKAMNVDASRPLTGGPMTKRYTGRGLAGGDEGFRRTGMVAPAKSQRD